MPHRCPLRLYLCRRARHQMLCDAWIDVRSLNAVTIFRRTRYGKIRKQKKKRRDAILRNIDIFGSPFGQHGMFSIWRITPPCLEYFLQTPLSCRETKSQTQNSCKENTFLYALRLHNSYGVVAESTLYDLLVVLFNPKKRNFCRVFAGNQMFFQCKDSDRNHIWGISGCLVGPGEQSKAPSSSR